jgi:hypothetical protein
VVLVAPPAALDPNPTHRTETVVRTLSTSPTTAAAKAEYASATWRTAATLADPSASLMDRYRAAEAEEAACLAAREAEAGPELEAGA